MRDLASFVMKGPRQAAIVAMASTLIPMLFWLGAAVVCLATLRRGLGAGLQIFAWAAIPALGWWIAGEDPGALIVLASSLLMASVLRATTSWQAVFASGTVAAIVIGLLVPWLAPGLIELLVGLAEEVFQQAIEEAQVENTDEIRASFEALMIASFSATFFGTSIGALCLARHWQATLYNPGGWRQEFHDMRLSPKWLLGAAVTTLVGPALGIDSTLILLTLVVPVLVCGLALVHGVIARKQLSGQWLVMFYMAIFLLAFPMMLLVVMMFAVVDSAVNFRGRLDLLDRDSED